MANQTKGPPDMWNNAQMAFHVGYSITTAGCMVILISIITTYIEYKILQCLYNFIQNRSIFQMNLPVWSNGSDTYGDLVVKPYDYWSSRSYAIWQFI